MTLYIHCKTTRYHNTVDLVTECGDKVARVYDGNSRLHAFQAVKFWRNAGLDGFVDPCVTSTSGGNGDSRYLMQIGRFDNMEKYGG